MTNKFLKWFKKYGILDDYWASLEPWQAHRIQRIAWRAYNKGKKDAKEQK